MKKNIKIQFLDSTSSVLLAIAISSLCYTVISSNLMFAMLSAISFTGYFIANNKWFKYKHNV